jgi:integrase
MNNQNSNNFETITAGVKRIGQRRPLRLEQVWAIRVRLELSGNIKELALFNMAIDSMLRACDLVKLLVRDICHGDEIQSRAQVIQKKTHKPVQFEITQKTRNAVKNLIDQEGLTFDDYLFKSRQRNSIHLSTRQYLRIVDAWVTSIGLDKVVYGTHSMRRTKASIMYKETKNLRAIQILLGHTKIDTTVRYLGVEVDDALELAEKIDV